MKADAGGRELFSGVQFGMDDGGSARVSPAAFGVLAECGDVRNGTLQTATGTVALPNPGATGRGAHARGWARTES